jgi:hypothetical protein
MMSNLRIQAVRATFLTLPAANKADLELFQKDKLQKEFGAFVQDSVQPS